MQAIRQKTGVGSGWRIMGGGGRIIRTFLKFEFIGQFYNNDSDAYAGNLKIDKEMRTNDTRERGDNA